MRDFSTEAKLETVLKALEKRPNYFYDRRVQESYIDACMELYHKKGYKMFERYVVKFSRKMRECRRQNT